MHPSIYRLSLVSATLLLSLTCPLQPTLNSLGINAALAQTATTQQRKAEAERLLQQGAQQYSQSQFREALETFQQALVITREIDDKTLIASALNNIAAVYYSLGEYSKALEFLQQALAIVREVGDKVGEGTTLNNIGKVYRNLRQYPKALEFYQKALVIHREVGDKAGEGTTLSNIGEVYGNLEQYPKALEFYQQALAIHRGVGDKAREGATLNNIGLVYDRLGQYSKALEFLQQALPLFRQVGNKAGEGTTLSNIGEVYGNLGQYPKALEFYQQALPLLRQVGDKAGEGTILNNIGLVYRDLGQYPKALEFLQQALAIHKKVDDKTREGATLNNIGLVYDRLGQYPKALEFYQQALAIAREIGDKAMEGTTLNNIGGVYDRLGQYPKALEFYQQALAIHREVGNKAGEGATLNNMGLLYGSLGQYPKALDFYQQALAIVREVGDKVGEGTTLSNIGGLLAQQNQPQLAIVFYKQSVNITETIRQDIRVLSREQQQSYTETVAGRYRSLADLLLSQGRILEAQQVLELLKIQELRDYTRNARAGGQTEGIALNPTEEQITKTYGSLIAFGQRVNECKQTQCSQLSQLNEQLQALTAQYNQTILALKKPISDRLSQDRAFLNPESLPRKAKEIVESQPGTVLIYPFVLEDKIWLLWASSGGVVKSVEVPVTRRQLGKKVLEFRSFLGDLNSDREDLKATSKQLYDWLIKPLEPELKANQIKNLIFSLDRVTRYIPMSALFDGEKYLIENYTVSTVISAELTDLRDRLPSGTENTSILALGLSNAVANFNALPHVPGELDAIVRKNPNDPKGIYPGSEFLNSAFDFPALRDNLLGRKILHIATHGDFVPGNPEDSYLLLGTGEKLSIPQIDTLQDLGDVHLVVLSACETALGGADQDGVEIAGISYYFLNRGAKAVMASLWLVSDESTSQLMQIFYQNLANGKDGKPMTKAEALREAQLSLLRGTVSGKGSNTVPEFDHPYYWAPFILIGNGL